MPDLHIVLHTSGVAVGRRHPLHRGDPEVYSPVALRQMAHLHLTPQPAFFVDATSSPAHVAKRVCTLLDSKVFKVSEAQIEGMEHLLKPNPELNH